MDILVDDVGSFPLPTHVSRKLFDEAYVPAREAIIRGEDLAKDEFLDENFRKVILDSFRKKLSAGLDVVNYPQHYDMHKQFAEVIRKTMDEGTYVVSERDAIIPEVHVISQEGKMLCEEAGKKILLRASITGPMELYLKEAGTTSHKDILMMFAETVNRFAKHSILDSKFVKTQVVSIDEPSFGFQDVSADRDTILDVLEKAFDFNGVTKQIHLHSSSRIANILNVKNIDVLSFEYAASPKNIESVSKQMLDRADKQVRVGISRTDIDSIVAELYDRGVSNPSAELLVESEEIMKKRFLAAKKKYGDKMVFTGPDCGLGGWPTQEAAQLVLKRTVSAAKSANIAC
jgi:5-methyltetrahydropteroyltriglutamate--homocysteine methyltransferase